MGTYINAAGVRERIGDELAVTLTTDTGINYDDALIEKAIGDAEGQIEAAVRKRTAAPITAVDHPMTFNLLRGLTLDVAAYRIHLRRPPVPEDWKQRHDAALAFLDKLVKGEVELPDATLTGDKLAWGSKEQNAATLRDL